MERNSASSYFLELEGTTTILREILIEEDWKENMYDIATLFLRKEIQWGRELIKYVTNAIPFL